MQSLLSYLIPRPREIEEKSGGFAWNEEVAVVLEAGNEEDRFAAQTLEEACRERGIASPGIRETAFDPGMALKVPTSHVILAGDPCRHLPLLQAMREEGLKISKELGDEGYLLHVTPQRILIAGNSAVAVFHGIQTLIQLLPSKGSDNAALPCVSIKDWPSLRQRGILIDLARGEVPTPGAIKKYISHLARYKINALVLYMEDAFLFPSHPDIGGDRDRLTTKEVREIDEWALRHHIDLIPAVNSPGHMGRFLSDPNYERFAEGTSDAKYRDVIDVTDPEAYSFLRDLYTDISRAFSSPFHFICGDEAFGLGGEKSKGAAEAYGLGNLHVRHIKKIREILADNGKRAIIAGDAFEPDFFKEFGLDLDNYGLDALYQVPRDMIIAPWHYGRVEQFSFGEILKDSGFQQILGAWLGDRNGVFPQVDDAAENMETFLPFAHRLSALGAVCTNWGDRVSFREYHWPMIAFFSEWAWECPGRPREELLRLSVESIYGLGTAPLAQTISFLGNLFRYFGWSVVGLESPGLKMFFSPIAPLALDEKQLGLLAEFRGDSAVARDGFREAKASATCHGELLDYFEFALDQFDTMADLVECRHLMAQEDEESREALADLLEEVSDSVTELAERYGALWLRWRRPRGLEVNLRYFENLMESIESVLESMEDGDLSDD